MDLLGGLAVSLGYWRYQTHKMLPEHSCGTEWPKRGHTYVPLAIELKARLPKACWRLGELQVADMVLQGWVFTLLSVRLTLRAISCHPPVAFGIGIFTYPMPLYVGSKGSQLTNCSKSQKNLSAFE